MGGMTPPYEPLPRLVFLPPKRGAGPRAAPGTLWLPLGANPRRANPSGGVSGAVPPQMAPLISGLLGIRWGSIPWSLSLPIFTDLYRLSWEFILVIVELYSQLTTCSHTCFFFRNRPLEKLPHQSCRAFRGEVDSSVPRVFGGLLVVVFEA